MSNKGMTYRGYPGRRFKYGPHEAVCLDCLKDLVGRPYGTERCIDCGEKRRKRQAKEWRDKKALEKRKPNLQ